MWYSVLLVIVENLANIFKYYVLSLFIVYIVVLILVLYC